MSFDTESFIDGYVTAALWADCLPAEPTDDELADFAWEKGATKEYLARAATDRLLQDYGESYRDRQEHGGREGLEIRPAARDRMAVDCLYFIADNRADLDAYVAACLDGDRIGYNGDGSPEEWAGHDFWLTRGGHGCGFWDRGLGELGERLADAARVYGEPDSVTPCDMGDGTADTIGGHDPTTFAN